MDRVITLHQLHELIHGKVYGSVFIPSDSWIILSQNISSNSYDEQGQFFWFRTNKIRPSPYQTGLVIEFNLEGELLTREL